MLLLSEHTSTGITQLDATSAAPGSSCDPGKDASFTGSFDTHEY
ncbi:hypothetical protein [Streptomyces sp. NPDC005970]